MPQPITDELRDLLALHLVEGLGAQRIGALLERFGTAARARKATEAELLTVPGIGDQIAAKVAVQFGRVNVADEVERITQAGVELLALGKSGYPELLSNLPNAPRLLYAKGEILPRDSRAVALVGTRHPDAYGKRIARQLAQGLARAGVTVVSGLARGIDGLAHQATLEAGGRTIAVLAGGLSRIYPPEHHDLAQRVVTAGALLTEAAMAEEPTRWRFPARNRIISGLSRIIVIVQAPGESGALITAEHAAEQGRTVMAVPGQVDATHNVGCHGLLRQGAILCRSVDDVLEELDGVSRTEFREEDKKDSQNTLFPAEPPPGLNEVQRRIWEYLGEVTRAVDEIAQKMEMPVAQLSGTLLAMEMKKLIRRLPGNRYERIA